MKFKVLLATAVMLAAWSIASAVDGPLYGTPRGGPQALATADYGGVLYSTAIKIPYNSGAPTVANFSTIAIPVPSVDPRRNYVTGVFYGVMFSSGPAGSYDFVDVFDSTSSDRATVDGPVMRLYNVNGSTTAQTSALNGAASGFSGPPKPMRFSKGLILRAGAVYYNLITVLYNREP